VDRIDTVYLLGAGCVEGAWDPVLRAVSRHAKTTIGRDEADWWFSANGQFLHLFSSWQGMTNDQLESRFGEGDHDSTRSNL